MKNKIICIGKLKIKVEDNLLTIQEYFSNIFIGGVSGSRFKALEEVIRLMSGGN